MVILYFTAASLLLWALLCIASYAVLRSRGGEIEVDNERDINPRHFANVLRRLLTPALDGDWGEPAEGAWRFGLLVMRRRPEVVGVYHGDLQLGRDQVPRKTAAIIVKGSLAVDEGAHVDCDVWCLGDVVVGCNCHLRSLAAEGHATLGRGTRVERWVDAGRALRLGPSVNVVAQASAGEELVMDKGIQGGKFFAPTVRMNPDLELGSADETASEVAAAEEGIAREAARAAVAHWEYLRASQPVPSVDPSKYLPWSTDGDIQWATAQSAYAGGELWVGPSSVVLHDLVGRGSVVICPGSVVAGSIHADADLRVGTGALVTGDVACRNLILEDDATVAGSAHCAGDAIIGDGAVIGLKGRFAGLAAVGCVQIQGRAEISYGMTAGNTLFTGGTV